jgi:caa(3)-type oxidase subunit IV
LLTVVEIGVTYLPVQRIFFLVPLALIKASLVVLYFMHLKSDQIAFKIVFIMGVLMGISLIIAMILLFAPTGFNGR